METDKSNPDSSGIFSPASRRVEALEKRFVDAIESWYAAHFHKCALAGVSAISADDKNALVASVTAAASTQPEDSSHGTV